MHAGTVTADNTKPGAFHFPKLQIKLWHTAYLDQRDCQGCKSVVSLLVGLQPVVSLRWRLKSTY